MVIYGEKEVFLVFIFLSEFLFSRIKLFSCLKFLGLNDKKKLLPLTREQNWTNVKFAYLYYSPKQST